MTILFHQLVMLGQQAGVSIIVCICMEAYFGRQAVNQMGDYEEGME